MAPSASAILEQSIGFASGSGKAEQITHSEAPHVRSWLILKGVSPKAAQNASLESLGKAYGIPSYLNGWLAREGKKPNRAQASAISDDDLSYELGDDEEVPRNPRAKASAEARAEADWLLPTTSEIASAHATVPSTVTGSDGGSGGGNGSGSGSNQIVIDQAAINRAARLVITPQITEAKRELRQEIMRGLLKAYDEFTLSEQTKREIADVAWQAAEGVISKWKDDADARLDLIQSTALETISRLEAMVPRAVEIRINGRPQVILPAEPRHRIFDDVVSCLASGDHVYLVGPAGTGKTHLFKQVCVALGYDLETQFFPIDMALTKYDVKGFKAPQGEYVQTLVYKAVKFGGLMCIDEGDMWAAAALGSLNSILANDFGTFGDEVVPVHPNFRCIVAANTFGFGATSAYIGRNPLDAASLDRFVYLTCDYDEDLELMIHGDSPWARYVHRVRKAVSQLAYQHVISMRAIPRGLKRIASGWDADRVCQAALWRNLPQDSILKIKQIAGEFQLHLPEQASAEAEEVQEEAAD